MGDDLAMDKRAYRNALCRLSNELRLSIELDLLNELLRNVAQAQKNFDALGGQSCIDSVKMCLREIRSDHG